MTYRQQTITVVRGPGGRYASKQAATPPTVTGSNLLQAVPGKTGEVIQREAPTPGRGSQIVERPPSAPQVQARRIFTGRPNGR